MATFWQQKIFQISLNEIISNMAGNP